MSGTYQGASFHEASPSHRELWEIFVLTQGSSTTMLWRLFGCPLRASIMINLGRRSYKCATTLSINAFDTRARRHLKCAAFHPFVLWMNYHNSNSTQFFTVIMSISGLIIYCTILPNCLNALLRVEHHSFAVVRNHLKLVLTFGALNFCQIDPQQLIAAKSVH